MESFDIRTSVRVSTPNEYNAKEAELIEAAKKATQKAYAPYSNYNVGAAVLLANGEIIVGNNQENAAYPSGLCAERTALFYANATYPDIAVVSVAIAAYTQGDYTKDVCVPCGSCRQVFVEIEQRHNQKIKILMCGRDKVYEVDSIEALLPLSFGKESLKG